MQPQASPLMGMVPILAVFAIFYLLIIRPQQKQAKEHEKMLADLKTGDRVLTGGGVYGTIAALRGVDVEVKIADKVTVVVARSTISRLANPPASPSEAASQGAK